MKISAMNAENNVLNSIDPGKSSVIKETLSRHINDKEITGSLTSNDVHISDNALLYSRIREVINRLPEFREDKIKTIENELMSGGYKVSSADIASKLLSEHITGTLSGE